MTELEAWVPLPVVFVALPCACVPLGVFFAAALACAASKCWVLDVETAGRTGCFGAVTALEAWVPLTVVFVALPCACVPLGVFFAAALVWAASS